MEAVVIDVFVLNFNGRPLLAECLSSIVQAAASSRYRCRVTVIDNASTDDSVEWLRREHPMIAVRSMANVGLCSFNEVVLESEAPVCVLLNNDVKAAEDALDVLVEPLLSSSSNEEPLALTAPRCYLFDGTTHEGLKTAVTWRYGLVQATSHFEGAAEAASQPGPTASAGAVLAVNRAAFLELGGFDPLYFPGRIEDLDFGFRAFQAGYRSHYVPGSVFFHRGAATFGAAFGRDGCDHLALRNTLLFQWRRLRHPWHLVRQIAWLPVRIVRDVVRAPFVPIGKRWAFCRAAVEAAKLTRSARRIEPAQNSGRERDFFLRHSPEALRADETIRRWRDAESIRDQNYPLSRHYLRPAACKAARKLARLGVPANAVTAMGVICAVLAAIVLCLPPQVGIVPAVLILASWFCDRIDGPLARLRGTASPLGAWLDANIDEFVDLGLHTAVAAAASRMTGSPQPWLWLIAFLVGKYLLMHGLASDDVSTASETPAAPHAHASLIRRLYHFPANADVRAHLLILAVACRCLTLELALIAIYYNLRWPIRYVLLLRRARAAIPAGATT
jgi:GT2 family glycosyltransferase/phosphatidylglycerophosphate synthase